MRRALVVRGRQKGARLIELDEPIQFMPGILELVVLGETPTGTTMDVFSLIASLRPGNRSKAEIDQQLEEERAGWGDR